MYNVSMTIQKMLFLESEAKEAMNVIEKEQQLLSKKTEAELSIRIAGLEKIQAERLRELTNMAEEKTYDTIQKINAEYEKKGSDLTKTFNTNRKARREKVINEILYNDIWKPQL